MVFFVGDLHGSTSIIIDVDRVAKQQNISHVIQVGDFGLGWPGPRDKAIEYFEKNANEGPQWIVALGNHDNYTLFPPDKEHIIGRVKIVSRNHVEIIDNKKYLFLGGAVSSDSIHRKLNKSIWLEEAPSQEDMDIFISKIEIEKPDIIVTHDGPHECYHENNINFFTQRSTKELSRFYKNVRKYALHAGVKWFYGHHHELLRNESDFCCGLNGDGWVMHSDEDIREISTKHSKYKNNF